jgi:phage repressor protein C with HTH and peptisase S24 domain
MLSKEEDARRERLVRARVAMGHKSARAASAALGVAESSYRSHENGQRPIKEASAMFYAERWNVRYEWLWDGSGEMQKNVTAELTQIKNRHTPNATLPGFPASIEPARLPIRGRAQGGSGGEIVLDGTVMDTLPGPSQLTGVDGAYGLEVIGESMMKRYRPGEIVWVDPRRAVHKGDNAVFQVRMPTGELHAFIKEFVRFSNGHVVAYQHNPEMELTWDRDDVEAIHLIVGTGIR